MIELYDIHKSFGDNQVLRGLTLTINEGQTMVVLGRSGCGKSVLVKIILGLLKKDKGAIIVDGENISAYDEEQMMEVRKKFGMLFQSNALFDSLTVGENVAYPLREHTKLSDSEIKEKVAEKLSFVEMRGTEALMPSELSGGMKKRVALARAMAMEPKYLLFDEPTTGLDPITAKTINELIRRTQKELKVTSVVVTHDLNSAYFVGDRLALIQDGVILTSGTVKQIKESKNQFLQEFLTTGEEYGDA